jgi:hypothetical protein
LKIRSPFNIPLALPVARLWLLLSFEAGNTTTKIRRSLIAACLLYAFAAMAEAQVAEKKVLTLDGAKRVFDAIKYCAVRWMWQRESGEMAFH